MNIITFLLWLSIALYFLGLALGFTVPYVDLIAGVCAAVYAVQSLGVVRL
jgi:hypothetical protein